MILLSLHKRVRYLVENAIVLCFFHVCDIESYPWCIISGWIILNVKISWDLNMKFYLLLCLQDEIDLILLSTVYYHLLKQLLHTEMDKKPFALNLNFFFFFWNDCFSPRYEIPNWQIISKWHNFHSHFFSYHSKTISIDLTYIQLTILLFIYEKKNLPFA